LRRVGSIDAGKNADLIGPGQAMDRDFLRDLFSEFGPVDLRRMFSGYGISVNGTNFAMVLRGGIYFRADAQTQARFQDENSKPFQYQARGKLVTVNSYWALPERLYDDPADLAEWAREALAAAERAAVTKRTGVKRPKKQIKKLSKKLPERRPKKRAKAVRTIKPRSSKKAARPVRRSRASK
jgi:DNA transformation protein and related proteins